MAKKSSIEKNKRRESLVKKFAAKRARLKTTAGQALEHAEQDQLAETGGHAAQP